MKKVEKLGKFLKILNFFVENWQILVCLSVSLLSKKTRLILPRESHGGFPSQ